MESNNCKEEMVNKEEINVSKFNKIMDKTCLKFDYEVSSINVEDKNIYHIDNKGEKTGRLNLNKLLIM
jgi:hypothetical protein